MFKRSSAVPQSEPVRVVLIADADQDTRALYRALFTDAGYDIIEAADGAEALAKALDCEPALIVAELRLPTIDGYGLCEVVRRDRATAKVPIVIVTTETTPASIGRATRLGANVVLAKPAGIDRLMDAVAGLLEDRGGNEPAELAPAKPRTGMLNRIHERYQTSTPPEAPPTLRCPSCDAPLTYEHSFVGGVNTKRPEQWDYFSCPTQCGAYQYRHRTRNVRPLE